MKTQVLRNNHLEKLNIFAILWLLLLGMSSNVYAQQFDHAYLKWKAEQQAQDAKLKKADENYYLSKPSVSISTSRSNPSASSKQASQLSSGTKVSLNSANLEQLQQLNGVGAKKAQAIIDYRNQNGKFNSIDDLQKVKGIGPKLFEKNKSQLSL
ncbi:ComEA family DNA-binding protein [Acinetobacter wuhouensis]|uniref:ComEA family DNA-binding protein n=1 Tax=Acinetobacter wuhouensis TaxID=1879050 RepID=A0A4Q7AK94_9GAMM|nr:ComEA family DNA-binding protein [Acinetobacter wuhouensis]RZG46341.1 ComEA family DNA-binding protein [Acinetobacter wuhouensis]RZG71179.1 ComEA family DNA-binding protein [Acinetobacter wuhouensis]